MSIDDNVKAIDVALNNSQREVLIAMRALEHNVKLTLQFIIRFNEMMPTILDAMADSEDSDVEVSSD